VPMHPDELIAELKKSGKRMRALHEKRYLKSDRTFFGVAVPVIRKLAAPIAAEFKKNDDLRGALRYAHALWQTEVHEPRTSAILIIAGCEPLYDEQVWELGRGWLDQIDNWGHCDGISSYLLAPLLQNSHQTYRSRRRDVTRWIRHDNPWVRRAALVSTIRNIRADKECKLILKLASRDVTDPDYFVQKGLGWMLRECAHHNPREVISFIQQHRDLMRRSTITNAISRLPKTLQKAARNG